MRRFWKIFIPVALVLSLVLNIGLVIAYGLLMLDYGISQTYQEYSWRDLARERHQLKEMRQKFCEATPNPTRDELLTWERDTRPADRLSAPFDKDGLIWLRDVAVKLDDETRLEGVCLFMTWQSVDAPGSEELDHPADSCPLEPLC